MTTETKEMEVVKGLDLERYMGRWYEIASFPSRFQPKNGVDTRATYTLNPDGTVHVLNETWNGGKRGYIQGSAYKTDPKSDEAKFKVKFYVPPFLPIIPVTGDYWVLYIDPDYQHAVIGQPSRSYLWILSRTAHMEEEIVKKVNQHPNAGWTAAINDRFSNTTVAEFKRLLGVKQTPKKHFLGVPIVSHDQSLKLPKAFDARTAWPQCTSIGNILDQGHCGSCWAFGAVESLSDRFCIQFGMNISLSVNDLLACCGFRCGDGCDGGYPIAAWQYFSYSGVVTEECDPYFDNTGCSHPGCEPAYPTPKCLRKCVSGNQLWTESKHYSVSTYTVEPNPQDIMAEIYKNGPVEVSFTVYEDFAHYKSGVYKHITGSNIGGHAVKLIGWGTTDDGEDYWLLANQWNRSWGDDGYFMIRRGTNECGIEDEPVGGLPSSKNVFKVITGSDEVSVASV